jgi:hypothetical protein
MNNKIGIGIICTHNNIETVINSVNTSHDLYVVSDKFLSIPNSLKDKIKESHIYYNDTPKTWAKNKLIRMMINDECDHLFILEDSIEIKNNDIFNAYINAAKISGMWCMLYNDKKEIVNDISYEDITIAFTKDIQNHLMYIFRGVIKNIGFFDERYDKGILENYDYLKKIIDKKLLPGWGWFPDLKNSNEYITILKTKEINQQDWWYENIWFNHKHKNRVDDIEPEKEDIILNNLEKIKKTYSYDIHVNNKQ